MGGDRDKPGKAGEPSRRGGGREVVQQSKSPTGLAVWVLGVAIAAVAGVTWVAPQFTDAATAKAIVAAASICTGAGVLAMMPPLFAVGWQPDYLVQAGLAMMAIRLFLTLAVGWVYLRMASPPENAFYLAMVVCYLVGLGVETALTVSLVRRTWRPPQSSGSNV